MSIIKLVEVTEVFGDELGINIFQLLQAVENLCEMKFPFRNEERQKYLSKVLRELSEINVSEHKGEMHE